MRVRVNVMTLQTFISWRNQNYHKIVLMVLDHNLDVFNKLLLYTFSYQIVTLCSRNINDNILYTQTYVHLSFDYINAYYWIYEI